MTQAKRRASKSDIASERCKQNKRDEATQTGQVKKVTFADPQARFKTFVRGCKDLSKYNDILCSEQQFDSSGIASSKSTISSDSEQIITFREKPQSPETDNWVTEVPRLNMSALRCEF